MKKLLLLAVLFTSVANAALQTGDAKVEYKDNGSIEAIVCKAKDDAKRYIEFAGSADTAGFSAFVKERFASKNCAFLNSIAQIEVMAHDVVMTENGPLWVVNFRQKDVYGKYDYWWASANYFPVSYPKTEVWEMDLYSEENQKNKAAE